MKAVDGNQRFPWVIPNTPGQHRSVHTTFLYSSPACLQIGKLARLQKIDTASPER